MLALILLHLKYERGNKKRPKLIFRASPRSQVDSELVKDMKLLYQRSETKTKILYIIYFLYIFLYI